MARHVNAGAGVDCFAAGVAYDMLLAIIVKILSVGSATKLVTFFPRLGAPLDHRMVILSITFATQALDCIEVISWFKPRQ